MEENRNTPVPNKPRKTADVNGTPQKRANAPQKKKKKKQSLPIRILKKLVTVIATTLLSLFLVIVITGTIVSTALTVYVLNFMDEATSITLQELETGSDTYFYGLQTNEAGEEELVVLHRVKTDVQRIPISIDRVPQHVRDAFVSTEDERFYAHDGVDYKRTLAAFLNMFMHFYDTEQGGSTITQQLIKNLTGDDRKSPDRKIKEIFSAMQLEKTYSKDEILEEYLNYIGFGGAINGIQLASIRYFGKNVDDLTVPEAAVLAAIPQSPNFYGPFMATENDEGRPIVDGKANNRVRQEYVLYKMYTNGAITYDEYQNYLNTPILYTDSPEYLASHPEATAEELEQEQSASSWVVDAMYYEAADFIMEQYNLSDQTEAIRKINKGGYRIYSCVDDKMQKYIEEKFLDINNIYSADSLRRWADIDGDGTAEEYLPHIAFVAMNYDGEVLALVGDWGEKKGSLVTNYAVSDPRQVGSTMKPISTYGLALETDLIHWGTTFRDEPIMKAENGDPWPYNYGKTLSYETHNMYYFLQKSFNTVPAQLCQTLTPAEVYKFCTEKLGLQLNPYDEAIAPLSLGALTYGVTLENLVNAYLPYGNEGVYNEAHIITRIEDSAQNIIYQNDGNPREAVSDETAWVMNRLLKNVVENGTGTAAKLSNKVLCGKTGTTDNWYDETFVGLTRDFLSGITIGYKYNNDLLSLPSSISAKVWYNIIGEYADTQFADTPKDFEPVKTVLEMPMCTVSGEIAGQYCPKGSIGYWKSTNAPVCTGGHGGGSSDGDGDSSEGGDSGSTDGNGGGDAGYATGGDDTGNGGGDAGYTGGGDTGNTGGGDAGYTGGDAGTGGGDAGYTGGDTGGGEDWSEQ